MHFSIRSAIITDAEIIADISRQTFYDTFAADNSQADMDKFLNEQFTRDNLMAEVSAPENSFLLACQGSEVVGYMKLRESQSPPLLMNSTTLEIARLYSLKHFIGKGVGGLLMQTAVDMARERKKQVLWLGVWEKNQRAIHFYTKWGFEKFDDTKFLLGDDFQNDWLMRKFI